MILLRNMLSALTRARGAAAAMPKAAQLEAWSASSDRALMFSKLHRKRDGASALADVAKTLSVIERSSSACELQQRQVLGAIACHLHRLGESDAAKVRHHALNPAWRPLKFKRGVCCPSQVFAEEAANLARTRTASAISAAPASDVSEQLERVPDHPSTFFSMRGMKLKL